jgi:membrane protein implicated in regulation of membrane protease activity
MIWGQPVYWYWFAGGVLISVVEIFLPGVLFIWLGIGAVATGLAVLAAPGMAPSYQFLIFAVCALIATVAGRKFVKSRERPSDHPDLNRRAVQYVGQVFTLDAPTADGRGRMRVGDTTWNIGVRPGRGDVPAGSHVRVVGVEGATLVVEPVEGPRA